MGRTSFDGRTIASVLMDHGYRPVDRTGSHLKLRREAPHAEEVRLVSVPMHGRDDIPPGTMRSIADQCGANSFERWCEWIDRNR